MENNTESIYRFGNSLITLDYRNDPLRIKILNPNKPFNPVLEKDMEEIKEGKEQLKNANLPPLVGDSFNKFENFLGKDKGDKVIKTYSQSFKFNENELVEYNIFTDNYWVVYMGYKAVVTRKVPKEQAGAAFDVEIIEKTFELSPKCNKVTLEYPYKSVKDFISDAFYL